MTFQQVRYFLALCEERNFTRAAKKCGIKQSTLSVVVQRLERDLGAALIVRSNPIQLTAFGAALQPHFKKVDETVEQTRCYAASEVALLKTALSMDADRLSL